MGFNSGFKGLNSAENLASTGIGSPDRPTCSESPLQVIITCNVRDFEIVVYRVMQKFLATRRFTRTLK